MTTAARTSEPRSPNHAVNAAVFLRYDQLTASPLNPRKHERGASFLSDLAASIDEKGVLQNLVVRPAKDGGVYEIAAGEGRWRGVGVLIEQGKAAPDYQLPAVVRELSDDDMVEIGLIENTQRGDLHPLDEARAFLQLYDRRVKKRGNARKAQAEAVDYIAKKVQRTPRYVQKRIKLARDLIPEWIDMLERAWISVAVAQVLSTGDKKGQEEAFRMQHSGYNKSERLDESRVRGLTIKGVADMLNDGWRALDDALFDVALYTGEIEDVDGKCFATDLQAFDALQNAAARQITKAARQALKAGEIEFFEVGENFRPHLFDQRKGGDGAPDPAGGIYLEKRKMSGEIRLYRGLFKTEEKVKEEKADERAAKERKKWAAQSSQQTMRAAQQPQRPDDPRLPVLHAYAEAHPELRLAVDLYTALCGDDAASRVRFAYDPYPSNEQKQNARAHLRKLVKTLPTGWKLLEWLLSRKPAELLPAFLCTLQQDEIFYSDEQLIEKPTQAEELLFKLAKAELPPELQPKATDGEAPAKKAKAAKKAPAAKKAKAAKAKPKAAKKKGGKA